MSTRLMCAVLLMIRYFNQTNCPNNLEARGRTPLDTIGNKLHKDSVAMIPSTWLSHTSRSSEVLIDILRDLLRK